MTRSVVVPAALAGLALLDGALAGFRASSGREARLPVRSQAMRATAWGLVVGVAGLAAITATALPWLAPAATRAARFDRLVDGGTAMLGLFLPLVGATALALGLPALLGNHEVRAAATTVVLGPLTLLRPAVLAGGCALGAVVAGGGGAWAVAAVATAATLAVGPTIGFLRYGRRRRPSA